MIRNITIEDKEEYTQMVQDFYSSDAVAHSLNPKNIENTINEALKDDTYVECFILEENSKTTGYAVLAKTFSQEAGGVVIWIEELYIKPEYRAMGIGKEFFKFVHEKYNEAKRFRLELTPDNKIAKEMYEHLGYENLAYEQMTMDF